MAEVMELSDILSDAPVKEAPAEVKDEAPPQERAEPEDQVERVQSRRREHRAKEFAAQGRDPDTGQFLPKDEPKAEAKPEPKAEVKAEAPPKEEPKATEAPKQEEMTQKERAAFAAAADERRKRQALETELARYRQAQPAPAQPAQPAVQPEKKKFWDDPEGALMAHEQRMAQRETQLILSTTERLARAKYTDFEDKIAAFGEIVQQAPALASQWLAAADPAEFAYRTGKTHLELREAGGLDALRVKIEKETRERVEKEMRETAEKERSQRAAIPPSLSQVRGASTQQRAEWNGPPPLLDILKG